MRHNSGFVSVFCSLPSTLWERVFSPEKQILPKPQTPPTQAPPGYSTEFSLLPSVSPSAVVCIRSLAQQRSHSLYLHPTGPGRGGGRRGTWGTQFKEASPSGRCMCESAIFLWGEVGPFTGSQGPIAGDCGVVGFILGGDRRLPPSSQGLVSIHPPVEEGQCCLHQALYKGQGKKVLCVSKHSSYLSPSRQHSPGSAGPVAVLGPLSCRYR